jgi:hypothetical protein
MSLPAGDLRWRLRIEALVTPPEDPEYGGASGEPEWVEVVTVHARRTNVLSATAEAVAAGMKVALMTVKFDVRPRTIDPAWRLVGVGGDHDGVVYDIKSWGTSNDGSETAIFAVSGASQG